MDTSIATPAHPGSDSGATPVAAPLVDDGILDAVRFLVRHVERRFIQAAPQVPYAWLQGWVDLLVNGVFLILSGGELLVRRALTVVVLWALCGGLFALLFPWLDGRSDTPVAGPAFCFAVALVVFMRPSRATFGDLDTSLVRSASALAVRMAGTPDALERLRAGIQIHQSSLDERRARIAWAMGFFWAGLCWFVAHFVLDGALSKTQRDVGFGYALIWGGAFFLTCLFYGGYMTALRVVARTLDFAFIDAQAVVGAAQTGPDNG